MPRAATRAPEPVTAVGVLGLVLAIETRPADAPASIAFRLALARKGREAEAAGGSEALDTLLRDVALADPDLAQPRTAILQSTWADLLTDWGRRALHLLANAHRR